MTASILTLPVQTKNRCVCAYSHAGYQNVTCTIISDEPLFYLEDDIDVTA